MSSPHPAAEANMNSIRYAMAGDKDAWLALFRDDAYVQDPVGKSPLDPSGEGHSGKAAIARFWDMTIGPAKLDIKVHQRIPCGDRWCAVFQTASNDLGGGNVTRIDMIVIYEVDNDGLLSSMRVYWEWDAMASQLRELGFM